MRSREPSSCWRALSAWSEACRARPWATSIGTSRSTSPGRTTAPASNAIWPDTHARVPDRTTGAYTPAGRGGGGRWSPRDFSRSPGDDTLAHAPGPESDVLVRGKKSKGARRFGEAWGSSGNAAGTRTGLGRRRRTRLRRPSLPAGRRGRLLCGRVSVPPGPRASALPPPRRAPRPGRNPPPRSLRRPPHRRSWRSRPRPFPFACPNRWRRPTTTAGPTPRASSAARPSSTAPARSVA